ECCQLGLPALYIPLPGAAGDEQTANAKLVARAGGCAILPQAGMTPTLLLERIQKLLSEPARLEAMGKRARALSVPAAADRVAKRLLEIVAEVVPGVRRERQGRGGRPARSRNSGHSAHSGTGRQYVLPTTTSNA